MAQHEPLRLLLKPTTILYVECALLIKLALVVSCTLTLFFYRILDLLLVFPSRLQLTVAFNISPNERVLG